MEEAARMAVSLTLLQITSVDHPTFGYPPGAYLAPFRVVVAGRNEASRNMHAAIVGGHAMGDRFAIICAVVGMLGLTTGGAVSKAVASDIIDEWANVKTPAAPEIKAVTVDPKTTALIMGDLMNQSCAKRPRCVAALPAMKKLLGEARAAKVAVIYSTIPNTTTADIIPDVAPAADEPSVTSGVDKFLKTNLDQILKDKGIQTIILVGTSAEGLVTYTNPLRC
jgi:hypothetical protein